MLLVYLELSPGAMNPCFSILSRIGCFSRIGNGSMCHASRNTTDQGVPGLLPGHGSAHQYSMRKQSHNAIDAWHFFERRWEPNKD